MYALNISSVLLFILLLWLYYAPSEALKFEYHDEKELEQVLKNFTKATKNINTKMYSIGSSLHKEVPLWVMELSGANKAKYGIPNIKFLANIHGNEAVGREMLLHYMEYLRDEYEKNDLVKCLLDNSNIHLLPCMDPDGFAAASPGQCNGKLGRGNGKEGDIIDLNRYFPDYNHDNRIPLQPETEAIEKWMKQTPFILSAALHGGAMVANYPFDTMKIEKTSGENRSSLTPDNDVFEHLASVYSTNHPKMRNSQCEDGIVKNSFKNGITNGAAWYSITGGMQDYNYFAHGCMEITLEISCCKYPRDSELSKLWQQNKQALLMYSLEALKGVAGQVLDGETKNPIGNAKLKIVGRNMSFNSSENGEFWRILLPGTYQIEVAAPGYIPTTENFTVETTKDRCPQPTRLQILLTNSSISNTPSSSIIHVARRSILKHSSFKRFKRSKIEDMKIKNVSGIKSPSQGDLLHPSIKSNNNVMVTLSQTINRGFQTTEGIKFLRDLFQNPELDVAKLTTKDMEEFLNNDLQISAADIKHHFEIILRDFDSKSETEKIEVFIRIFDEIIEEPVIKTDGKWLETYVHDAYITKGLRSDNKYFSIYNHSNVFEKLEIILLFNDLFEQKGVSNCIVVSLPLLCSALLLLFV